MDEWKRLGLINALLARPADTPSPARPRTLSALSQGLLGLNNGLGALPGIPTPPRVRGALEQVFAKSEHDRLVEKLRNRLVANHLYSDIKVDLPDYEKPTRIVWKTTQRGHDPDASAYYGVKQHIFEVETADAIADTVSQPSSANSAIAGCSTMRSSVYPPLAAMKSV
ncbi:MAG: hypothetical protein FJY54_16455 [Betaproteobacteria bacterium]|nr:hypothetical protein [Betaproteobacteria bacterium]